MISPDVYFDYESQEHSQSNHKNPPQEFLAGALHIATTMSTYYHFYADNFGLHWSCGNMWGASAYNHGTFNSMLT